MTHICGVKSESEGGCRFVWGLPRNEWCGKVVKCPHCDKELNYKLRCAPKGCPHYEPKKWYHLTGGNYRAGNFT